MGIQEQFVSIEETRTGKKQGKNEDQAETHVLRVLTILRVFSSSIENMLLWLFSIRDEK